MVNAIELKVGNVIKHKNSVYRVVSTEHVKPGKGGAFMQIELKGLQSNTKLNERFRSDESVERLTFESKIAQFLYLLDKQMQIMELSTYEQISLPIELLVGERGLLEDNMQVTLDLVDDSVIAVNLPDTTVVEIFETQPYIKGQTVKSSFKPAKLKNGISIQVPEFISSGEKVLISTARLEYIERVK